MSNQVFRFQQFQINQERCAMKVTRDACLLGSWAPVESCQQLLDIGTGTGLLALMCAQRTEGRITAIELDPDAAKQAIDNIGSSPWTRQIAVHHASLQQWQSQSPAGCYDGIICNPPFFVDSLRCPNNARNQARHTDQLTYTTLLQAIDYLLTAAGAAWLLLPTHNIERLRSALPPSLHITKIIQMRHSQTHPSKRALITLSHHAKKLEQLSLSLFDADGTYSPAATTLLAPYYLRFTPTS